MYKLFYLTLFMAALLQTTRAQTSIRLGGATTFVKNDYASWAHLGGCVNFETSVGRHFTFGGTLLSSKSITKADPYEKRLIELRPEFRYYFKQKVDGLFVGTFVMAGFESWKKVVDNPRYSAYEESIYLGPGISVGFVKPITNYLDITFVANGAANIGEPEFLIGGAVQVGFRF